MENVFFITGTDTNVGKTFVTIKLLQQFARLNQKIIGLKPVSTDAPDLINHDALLLQQASKSHLPLNVINPFVFKEPISPHLAAKHENKMLTSTKIKDYIEDTISSHPADYYFIEGAGGLMVPLNEHETWIDLLQHLPMKIILVVAIKLGCLNHALLTNTVIREKKLPFHGWIANCMDPNCLYSSELIETLKRKMDAPLLEVVEYEL